MNESVVEVFLGDPIGDRGELRVLNRLRGDLQRRGVPARVFANFVAAGRQQRQIDLLVATPARLVHAELKAVTPELPLVGDANGPWQQLLPDGRRRALEPNPYRQAHQGTYAISDVMLKLSRRNQVPEAQAFYKHIDTVVCLSPTIPAGSQLGPYKHVEAVGYDGLLARLLVAGPHPPWAGPHWEAFTRALGVYPQVEESAAERTRRADAAVVADYRHHFRGAQVTDLHELVAVPADVDGRQTPRPDLAGPATQQCIVMVLGPSGIGKTHTARHAAVELTDRGHVVVWLRCAEYEPGQFGQLLARAVAPFSTQPALELLRKAVDTGSAVVVVLDGVNECPSRLRPQLLEQLSALRLRVPIGVVITCSVPLSLPALLAAITVELRRPARAERVAILASYGVADPGVAESFRTPYELAIAAECWGELDPHATPTDLLDAYVRRRAGTASVRAALRRLAAAMDAGVRASLTAADAMAALQHPPNPPVPPAIIDETLSCPLLAARQGRVSFDHELLGRFLAAEDLVLRSPTGTALGRALAQPHHGDLRDHALLLERDPRRRHQALLALADADQLTRAALGEFGDVTGAQVRADMRALLSEAATATIAAEMELDRGDTPWDALFGVWRTARTWSPADRALLGAAGRCLRHAQLVGEVAALLDHTDQACAAQAWRLRTAGHPAPATAVVASAYAHPRTEAPSCLPASIVLQPCHDSPWSNPTSQPVVGELLAAGTTGPAWGRLYTAALLFNPTHPADVALLPDLLQAAWASGAYHLRLQALEVAHDAASCIDDPARQHVSDVLNGLGSPQNLELSSALVEALAAYGQLEPATSLADIQAEIRDVLAREDDPQAWAAASSIVSGQFDNEAVLGPYGEAIGQLPEHDRLRLLVMAVRTPASNFHAHWVLPEIVDSVPSLDHRGRQVVRDAATRIQTDTPFLQGAVAIHLQGLRGWARLADHLPPVTEECSNDVGCQAWRCFDELIFQLERGDGHAAGDDTTRVWSILLGECASAAVDVMHSLKLAAMTGSSLNSSAHDRLLHTYPDEVRCLLEWGLAHRGDLTTSFRSMARGRDQYIVSTLGSVGTATTAALLREHVADPALGAEAVTAIRRIEQRSDDGSR